MTILPLIEDYCPKAGFRGEHGLSLYIDTGTAKILFDTGQTDAFLHNARKLGIDLSALDAVILSHGHYDHCGGLGALYEAISPESPALYAGPGYANPKLARTDSGLKDIGIPKAVLSSRVPSAVEVGAIRELFSGASMMPRAAITDGTMANQRFRTIVGGDERIDEFDDELSLVFDGKDGLVVVTGCAHRGIVNIVGDAMRSFPGRPLAAVVGGFHLVDASLETIDRVADGMTALAPASILCGHCTGPRGFATLYEWNRGRVSWLSCGTRVEL